MGGGRGLNWGRLMHAYGPASDTPSRLHALTGDDWDAQLEAVDHLAYLVVHQYSVHPVTPFAVRVVAGLLDHAALRRSVDDRLPLLAEVLDFFDEVADTVTVPTLLARRPRRSCCGRRLRPRRTTSLAASRRSRTTRSICPRVHRSTDCGNARWQTCTPPSPSWSMSSCPLAMTTTRRFAQGQYAC